jgi:hypothetical protein
MQEYLRQLQPEKSLAERRVQESKTERRTENKSENKSERKSEKVKVEARLLSKDELKNLDNTVEVLTEMLSLYDVSAQCVQEDDTVEFLYGPVKGLHAR